MKLQTLPAEIQFLIKSLGSCICKSNFPSDRASCQTLLDTIKEGELAKFSLAGDLLFVVRQAVAIDGGKSSIRLKYSGPLLRLLAGILAQIHPTYKEFGSGSDEKAIGVLHHWIQDSDLFGSSNKTTKFLAQDLCAYYAREFDFYELFSRYKRLILHLFKSITEIGGCSDLEHNKLLEMEQRLNKVFAKDFYNLIISKINNLKGTPERSNYDSLKIIRVEAYQQMFIKIKSIFEFRETGCGSIPCESNCEIPFGRQAVLAEPWSMLIDSPKVFETIEFLYVPPLSRRKSGCDLCSEKGTLICQKCLGAKKADCAFCNKGLFLCSVCNGSGEESFVEYQQQIVICETCNAKGCNFCKMTGYLQNRISKTSTRTCSKCERTGWVTCPRCLGKLLVPCTICNSKGIVTCEKCDGKKSLEHHQIVTVTLRPIYKEFNIKEPTIPDDILLSQNDPNLTTIASFKGVNLSRQRQSQLFERDLPDGFFAAIIKNLESETSTQSNGFKFQSQKLICKVSQYFHIEYEYQGFPSKAWWHTKKNKINGDSIFSLVIPSLLKDALFSWQKRDFFVAVDTLLYAEKLSKKNKCYPIFTNYYKTLPVMLRFFKWVRKQFVVPDNV